MIELDLQKVIEGWLANKSLWPFSVLYIAPTRKNQELLKITFLLTIEVPEFLGYLDYDNLADKSGIEVISEHNTVLLQGLGLRLFFKVIENE